jgi:P-type conjugative transfer protein TrbJ
VAVLPATPAQAQMAVFDPRNYAQNILTAARTLQTVNQQIQQLQNEAQMLVNQGKNLSRIDFPQLDGITSRLAQIDGLMGRATNIDFKVDAIDDKFAKLYPRDFNAALTTDARVRDARSRLDASLAAYRQTMTIQAGVVENIHEDAHALKEIALRSQGAEGSLQAQQATNQLLALSAKQQFQLQQLMAAQFRSEATERARQATQAAEARAATKKFLGSGSAYTPE